MDTGLPFPSPTLVGCAIAVERNYFMNLGAFDEGMRIWGGENIELGFRTWMCGGQVKTITCSRVGHVFKVSFIVFIHSFVRTSLRLKLLTVSLSAKCTYPFCTLAYSRTFGDVLF